MFDDLPSDRSIIINSAKLTLFLDTAALCSETLSMTAVTERCRRISSIALSSFDLISSIILSSLSQNLSHIPQYHVGKVVSMILHLKQRDIVKINTTVLNMSIFKTYSKKFTRVSKLIKLSEKEYGYFDGIPRAS